MGNSKSKKIKEPCLHLRDNSIIQVNKGFVDLTGFSIEELLGKTLIEIGAMIRINSQIHLDNISSKYTGYIFTKSLKVREITISIFHDKEANEQVYTFVEKPNAVLNEKLAFFDQSLIDNICGIAIYSVPDLILLKSNPKNLDFFDFPFNKEENSIGRPLREILSRFAGTEVERIFNAVIEERKSKYLKQFEFNLFERGITYWDSSITPIIEDGKIKYLVDNSFEVTEVVLKTQKIERQNEIIKQQKVQMELQNIQLKELLSQQLVEKNIQLKNIIENLSEGVVIADNEGKYIIANSEAGRLIYKSNELNEIGDCLKKASFFDMEGKAIPRENMPGIRALKGEKVKNTKMLVKNPDKEYFLDVSSIPIYSTRGDLNMVISSFHDITEIVVQSKKIEEQKKNLEDIIEGLSEAVMVADVNGKFITINSAAKNMIYGWEKLSNSGDTSKYSKYFNMEGDEIAPENIPGIRALRGERIKSTKMFVSDPDREYFMEISSTPIYNIGGDLTMAVSSFRDITEAIEQSRKIDELKKELEAIIENLPTGVSVFDSEGQNILSNKASRTMFTTSLSSEQMDKLGDIWKVAEYYDIDGEKVELENIPSRRVLRGEKFNDSRMVLKIFNTEFHIDFSGIPIYDSNKRFIMGMVYSQNRAAYVNEEKAFKSRYDLVEKIIDTFDLPVVRISCPDLKLVDLNKKAFSVLKLVVPDIISIDQLKNNTIIDIFATAKSIEYHKFMGQVIIEKKTKYLNKIMFLLNGNPIYWNIIFEPVFKVNGEIEEILILLIDVTDEIKSNNIMEKTLRLQEEFIANISHELKTPLSVISSAVQLFSLYCDKGSLDDNRNSIVKYIDSIKQNSNRLSKLINNIVDSSKIEAGFFELNLSNNNIVQVVEELVMSVTNFTESKGLNIIFDTNIEEKIMACDPEKIDRILLNLISNAIKFSNVGDEIIVAINDMNEFVEISVKDSGIGIETKHLDMIFDRFKQVDKTLSRNAEGTGIGLSLVKSIAELHGGNICVESELGKGSKFTVKLPTQKTLQENTVYNCDESSVNEIMLLEFSDIFQ